MSIVRKSDRVIQVTVKDGNGSPITITTLDDLEILAYQFPKRIIQRWLLSDSEITTVNNVGGIVSVNFDRANTQTLNFKNDPCLLEVVALFTDADFEGGIRRDVATGIELEIVEDSPTAYEQ
jgi:hypothetical protein